MHAELRTQRTRAQPVHRRLGKLHRVEGAAPPARSRAGTQSAWQTALSHRLQRSAAHAAAAGAHTKQLSMMRSTCSRRRLRASASSTCSTLGAGVSAGGRQHTHKAQRHVQRIHVHTCTRAHARVHSHTCSCVIVPSTPSRRRWHSARPSSALRSCCCRRRRSSSRRARLPK